MNKPRQRVKLKMKRWGKTTANIWNDKAESIYLSSWYSMGSVSVSNTVLYNHCHPLMIRNKIISNQIMAKRGFCANVCLSGTCLHPYVCLSVCTYIYYITALRAYGSEAVDQHNDGDSMKTWRGFKPEEVSQDREREAGSWREVLVLLLWPVLWVCVWLCDHPVSVTAILVDL